MAHRKHVNLYTCIDLHADQSIIRCRSVGIYTLLLMQHVIIVCPSTALRPRFANCHHQLWLGVATKHTHYAAARLAPHELWTTDGAAWANAIANNFYNGERVVQTPHAVLQIMPKASNANLDNA